MAKGIHYPTPLHGRAATAVYDHFRRSPLVDTVLLLNSCARGVATPQSDLDMAVLVKDGVSAEEIAQLEEQWQQQVQVAADVVMFVESGPFTKLHLDVIDGRYAPTLWDDGGGPDSFELEVGNHVAYSAPIEEVGSYFRWLRRKWLPYYEESLRQQRLTMVRKAILYDLSFIPIFAERQLLFQAFDRLYKAQQEVLQLILMRHRRYPIAYNKWIKTQVVDWLGLPDMYVQLEEILALQQLAEDELKAKAEQLRRLVENV